MNQRSKRHILCTTACRSMNQWSKRHILCTTACHSMNQWSKRHILCTTACRSMNQSITVCQQQQSQTTTNNHKQQQSYLPRLFPGSALPLPNPANSSPSLIITRGGPQLIIRIIKRISIRIINGALLPLPTQLSLR